MSKVIQINDWKINFNPDQETLKEEYLNQASAVLSAWSGYYPEEPTWVHEKFGVRALLVAVDGSIVRDYHTGLGFYPYKVDEQPMGAGILYRVDSAFRNVWDEYKLKLPEIKIVTSPHVKCTDDSVLFEQQTLEEAKVSNNLVLVRAMARSSEYWDLQNRSVGTIQTTGDKSYGVAMGLWKEVFAEDSLDFSKAFCLRPKTGPGAWIWHPERGVLETNGVKGLLTKDQVLRRLVVLGSMYQQEYIEPMKTKEGLSKIYRLFFLYNIEKSEYECVGGLSASRDNVKVQGANDAVLGVIN